MQTVLLFMSGQVRHGSALDPNSVSYSRMMRPLSKSLLHRLIHTVRQGLLSPPCLQRSTQHLLAVLPLPEDGSSALSMLGHHQKALLEHYVLSETGRDGQE